MIKKEEKKTKDNRYTAFIAINLSAIILVFEGVLFKPTQAGGVSLVEYALVRNVIVSICSGLMIIYLKKDPVRDLPRDKRKLVFIRSLAGHGTFALFLGAL